MTMDAWHGAKRTRYDAGTIPQSRVPVPEGTGTLSQSRCEWAVACYQVTPTPVVPFVWHLRQTPS